MSNHIKIYLGVTATILVAVWCDLVSLPFGFGTALVSRAFAQQSVIAPVFSLNNLAYRNAKYSGYTQDGRRYELTTNSAVPNENGDRIFVDEPRVSLEMADGNRITVEGVTSIFEPKTNALTMYSVVLTSASGNAVRMGEAFVDMRENSVVSEKPVQVKFEDRTIRANRLELRRQGITIFDGMIIQPTNIIFFAAYAGM
jgi:hypothetical protein